MDKTIKTEKEYLDDMLNWQKEWDQTFKVWTSPEEEYRISENLVTTRMALEEHYGYDGSSQYLSDKLSAFEQELETAEADKDKLKDDPDPKAAISMPPEYEYLNAPLNSAKEHVFLINAEIEKLDGNPINEQRLVKLQDEKNNIIQGLKRDFEMQTFEEGPARTLEIESIVDQQLGDDAYHTAKADLVTSGKTYENSNYWQDRYDRNVAAMDERYGVYDNPNEIGDMDFIPFDDYEDLDKD